MMQSCNETITVFNKKIDGDKGYDAYYGTVISGVSWHCEIASNVDSSGLKAANKFTIRIPLDADCSTKAYAEPKAYAGGDPNNLFTLCNGDYVVKGVVTDKINALSDLQKLCSDVVTILGVTDATKAPHAKHWKVVGA